MDDRLRGIAHSGNIDALYDYIQNDANVFRSIDQLEFVDTPLHIAAEAGDIDFAMEMLTLKPSFGRKLNPSGHSPIHLALQHGHTKLVVDLLSFDKDLVRVRGRDGYTPLHYAATEANVSLLSQFMDHCPHSILDLTNRKETILHIAAQKNSFQALKAILEHIQNLPEDNQFKRVNILNLQDKNGNTVLHIAASNNQPEIIKPLTDCKEVDRRKVNERSLTPLGVILERQSQVDCSESVNILNSEPSMFTKLSRFRKRLSNGIKELKPDTVNALLVVFALVLSMTYQAFLSPPGGVSEGDGTSSNNNSTIGSNTPRSGKSVISSGTYIIFYAANTSAFMIAWVVTLVLLKVVAKNLTFLVTPLYLLLCFSAGTTLSITAPASYSSTAAYIGGAIVAFLYFFLIGL